VTDFERIFHPRRLAIIGVSSDSRSIGFGNGMLVACRAMGFAGEILPVNPKGGTFAGQEIYRDVEDIPGDIDFAAIAVPAEAVPRALEACRQKGAAGAEIVTAGFAELGTPEGLALERQVREVAARGIRVVGPNCFGVYCPRSGLTLLPGPDLSRESGPVAFVSQSGGMSIDFAHAGKWMGIRFSKVVSFGNGADLRETELLRYLGDDPETGVIAMYMEGVEDGDAFFDAARAVGRRKPVVVYKGGLSEAGRRAVVGHTASMGGSRAIWSGVLRQVNAVQVGDLAEMAGTCRGVSVIGGGGALGVAAGDAAEANGISIPLLPPELQTRIGAVLPKPGSSAGNPIDVANPFFPPEGLRRVLRIAAEDDRVELQVITSLLYHYKSQAAAVGRSLAEVTPFRELAAVAGETVAQTGKPVIVVLPNLKQGPDDSDVLDVLSRARQAFLDHGVPVFADVGDALRAVRHLNTYYRRRDG
jgi:acyl-CoA synthetase (NDP forming)